MTPVARKDAKHADAGAKAAGARVPEESKKPVVSDSQGPFGPDQVRQVQEAIRRAERDMADWRERSRVRDRRPCTRGCKSWVV